MDNDQSIYEDKNIKSVKNLSRRLELIPSYIAQIRSDNFICGQRQDLSLHIFLFVDITQKKFDLTLEQQQHSNDHKQQTLQYFIETTWTIIKAK